MPSAQRRSTGRLRPLRLATGPSRLMCAVMPPCRTAHGPYPAGSVARRAVPKRGGTVRTPDPGEDRLEEEPAKPPSSSASQPPSCHLSSPMSARICSVTMRLRNLTWRPARSLRGLTAASHTACSRTRQRPVARRSFRINQHGCSAATRLPSGAGSGQTWISSPNAT